MAGNSFGKIFRITTYGESHGPSIGVLIDGCPPGLHIELSAIQADLNRRRPGQSNLVSPRNESDLVEVLSGIYNDITLGSPIHLSIKNTDQRSKDYDHLVDHFRPSHADFTYEAKYGLRDPRGGGRSSARETVARVAAGAIAKQILAQYGVDITAYVYQVGPIKMPFDQQKYYPAEVVEQSTLRCPIPNLSEEMEQYIRQLQSEGDTTGGGIYCHISGCPVGWGEPVFDKLQADLAKAMLSINAVKGFAYGSGFEGIAMKGSDHNDRFVFEEGKVATQTNFSGGIQGGISNGMPIYFNVAFKPVSTLLQNQHTIDKTGNEVVIEGKGRHDVCVVPRAVPIVEAMAALVLVDHALRFQAMLPTKKPD